MAQMFMVKSFVPMEVWTENIDTIRKSLETLADWCNKEVDAANHVLEDEFCAMLSSILINNHLDNDIGKSFMVAAKQMYVVACYEAFEGESITFDYFVQFE